MKKIFWAVTFCFMLIFNATVSAEELDAKQALREAMLANAGEDNRVFHEELFLFVPGIQSELELFAVAGTDTFKSSGNFFAWTTADNGEGSEFNVPFYIDYNGKEMRIYYQTDKKWYQIKSPTIAAKITDTISSPTQDELETMLDEVKEVTILRDSDTQRTFLVRVDGDKFADNFKKELEKNPADNVTAEEKQIVDKFFSYLDTGFRKADTWYVWTIGKADGKTKNIAFHLSGLLQETAIAALDDKDQVWPEPIREILENIAYYSEVKSYTTVLNSDARKKLEIPKNVLKAKVVENISDAAKTKK